MAVKRYLDKQGNQKLTLSLKPMFMNLDSMPRLDYPEESLKTKISIAKISCGHIKQV
jgi:hypothetical protein